MKITRFALTAVLWIGLLEATRAASTYYVATNGTGNGTTWLLATSNIQAAVTSTVAGDIVLVSNGTYYCWSNSTTAGYTSMVTVTKAITIQSVNGPEVTIVNANFPAFTNRCFYISSGAILSGLTITNGHTCDLNNGGGVFIQTSGKVTNCWITGNSITNGQTAGSGGGVYCAGAGEVVNCRIYANITTNGGGSGVYANNGALIRDCVISNNMGTNIIFKEGSFVHAVYLSGGCLLTNCTIISNWGCGGLYLTGNPTVDTCRIVGNSSQFQYHRGAGIYMQPGGQTIVRNCLISDNSVNFEGSGIYHEEGGSIISNCVISNNYSLYGGAGMLINTYTKTALVQNCTIIGNRTAGADNGPGGGVSLRHRGILRNCLIANNYAFRGAGIYLTGGDTVTSVENCTIVNNTNVTYSLSWGGGIDCDAGSTGRVVNTIIYSNSAFVNPNWHTNSPGITFINCCTTPTNELPGSGNISNWPVFVDFAAMNFRLAPSSPCVNAGTNLSWMINAVDLDGRWRVDRFSGRPDLGCYELAPRGTMIRVR